MEQENNKNVVTIVLGVVVVILLVVCVLLATGTINFKSKKVDNKNNNSANVINTTDNNTDNTANNTTNNATNNNTKNNATTNNSQAVKTTRYYQFYEGDSDIYGSQELTLNVDGTAEWRFGGSTSGGASYKGTYKEDSTKIVFTGEQPAYNNKKCIDGPNNAFDCKTTETFTKKSDGTLVKTEKVQDVNGYTNVTRIFKLVDKSKFVLND